MVAPNEKLSAGERREEEKKRMKTKSESIAMLPEDGNDEHEWCSVCGDDNVAVVIQGGTHGRGTNCHYCGNTVVLCSKHAAQMLKELGALNLGL